jgi:hypothetical protein
VGNTEKSSGCFTYITVTSTSTDRVILVARRTSMTKAGSGTRMTNSRRIDPIGNAIPR